MACACTLALSISLTPSRAASLEAVSIRGLDVNPPLAANGDSIVQDMTPDGRFILFTSSASDLVQGDNGYLGLDLFVHDQFSNTTTLVSANMNGTGGGNNSSASGVISTNGRYVAFESDSTDLVPNDTNEVRDVFLRDLETGSTILISVGTNGAVGDSLSFDPSMTPDGRCVAFVSIASDLVTPPASRGPHVFVRNVVSNTTTLVSVGAINSTYMSKPVFTPDGRFVAFSSNSQGLVPSVTGNLLREVYLRDLSMSTTHWISSNTASQVQMILNMLQSSATQPQVSDDGQFVAFKRGSLTGTNVTAVVPIPAVVVYRHEVATGQNELVSTNGHPSWEQNDDVYGPVMTADGRFISFVQRELDSGSIYSSVRLWDALTGSNVLVSADELGDVPIRSLSHTPSISPDGRYASFVSNATNLVGNVVSNGFHIYLRDLLSSVTQLVDVDTNDIGSTDLMGMLPELSDDGRFVAFSARDGNLAAGDNNSGFDAFIRDTMSATNELISARDSTLESQTANAASALWQHSISADGRYVTFASHANDLVPNDTNRAPDVFVHDRLAGSNILVSAGMDGLSAKGGFSINPVISSDGRFVVFESTATNIAAAAANGLPQVFRRDLMTGTTLLVSITPNGLAAGDKPSYSPVISQDGRYVTFRSEAFNLGGGNGVFLWDANFGTSLRLPASSFNMAPSMSLDGRFVAYTDGGLVRVYDTQTNGWIRITSAPATSAALSPDASRLLYANGNSVFVDDVIGGSNVISFASSQPIRHSGVWSTNGRYFAFVTASNAVPQDTNGTNDVYLCNLDNGGALTLVSSNAGGNSSGSGPSDAPSVSADGRFVAYRSFATNIVPGAIEPPNIFVFDRLTGSNTLHSAKQGLPTWSSWTSRPLMSADGGTVTFQSWSPGLVAADLNRSRDVFVAVVDAAADSDGDGIPDFWTEEFFGHPTGEEADLSRASDDADGDGRTNWEEFVAGTDPTDDESFLRSEITLVVATSEAELIWPAAQGRTYRVEYKNDLSDADWTRATGAVSIFGGKAYFTVPSGAPVRRFYRISAEN